VSLSSSRTCMYSCSVWHTRAWLPPGIWSNHSTHCAAYPGKAYEVSDADCRKRISRNCVANWRYLAVSGRSTTRQNWARRRGIFGLVRCGRWHSPATVTPDIAMYFPTVICARRRAAEHCIRAGQRWKRSRPRSARRDPPPRNSCPLDDVPRALLH